MTEAAELCDPTRITGWCGVGLGVGECGGGGRVRRMGGFSAVGGGRGRGRKSAIKMQNHQCVVAPRLAPSLTLSPRQPSYDGASVCLMVCECASAGSLCVPMCECARTCVRACIRAAIRLRLIECGVGLRQSNGEMRACVCMGV